MSRVCSSVPHFLILIKCSFNVVISTVIDFSSVLEPLGNREAEEDSECKLRKAKLGVDNKEKLPYGQKANLSVAGYFSPVYLCFQQ